MRHSIAVLCSSAALALLVWAATQANAQSVAQSDETQTAPKNSLVKGAWALQFKVDSDAILSEFGGSVAIKRHVSAQSAFRVGFDYGFSTQDRDWSGDRQGDNANGMVGMFVDYLRYTDVESPIHFFWGTGPFGSFYRSRNTINQESSETESVITIWNAGVSGRVGVEWFATRSLSFHAEYFGTAYYERRTSESTITYVESANSSTITDDGWALSRGPVVFGLSAYF